MSIGTHDWNLQGGLILAQVDPVSQYLHWRSFFPFPNSAFSIQASFVAGSPFQASTGYVFAHSLTPGASGVFFTENLFLGFGVLNQYSSPHPQSSLNLSTSKGRKFWLAYDRFTLPLRPHAILRRVKFGYVNKNRGASCKRRVMNAVGTKAPESVDLIYLSFL